MDVKVKMPDFGTTSSEVTVLRWYVEPGQRVERGQALMEIETDKSTTDVESIVAGVVKELLVQGNESVEVGQEIVIIEVEGQVGSSCDAPPSKPAAAASQPTKSSVRTTAQATPRSGGFFARNRAQKPADGNDSQNKQT